jgi:hypothetical protein
MGNQKKNDRAANIPVRSQKFFTFCFKGFVAFDTFRFKRPVWFSLSGSIVVMAAVLCISQLAGIGDITNPTWWKPTGFLSAANATRALLSIVSGLIFTQPIARGLLPLLTILPQAIAMKNLGLLFVTTNYNECAKLFLKASSEHASGEKVKVICISGRYLFRELRLPGDSGIELPLHDLAMKGQLEVIMPVSDSNNPTINSRYETYSRDFIIANGVPTIERFIDFEIEAGKDFLLEGRNEVYEHNILCMWRVIIFSEHCLVQNYFPNVKKAESFRAPMFMYSKRVDGSEPHSYYEMYLAMFDLVKANSTRRTRQQTTAGPTPPQTPTTQV